MKKLYIKRMIASLLSMILLLSSCAFSTTALENDIDNIFANMEYDNEFYITQNESVKVYNEMLEAFSRESNQTYSLSSKNTGQNYPEYYGGAYIDEKGELVVLVTEKTNTINSKVRQATGSSSIVTTELCNVSYNEMCYVIDFLSDKIDVLESQGVTIDTIGDDIMNGKVVISIVDWNYEKEEKVRDLIDCDFLSFVNSKGAENTSSTVGGGYGISSDSGTSTAGFAATYSNGGAVGLVVAGHAFPNFGDYAYYNGNYIGFVWETACYYESTADVSFITPDSDVNITAVLKNNGRVMSGSTLDIPVNTTVYMYGNRSSLQSGKVTATNMTISYSNSGCRFKKQVRATYSSQAGDSGAPILFYDGNYDGNSCYLIYGIHSGHNTSLGVSYFSPYKNIVNELGISCVTS